MLIDRLSDYALSMQLIRNRALSILFVTLHCLIACTRSGQLVSQSNSDLSARAETAQPWTQLCLPFSDEAVESANLTEQERVLLPDLCYQPDLSTHLFGSEEDRGIPPGVDCNPFEW